MANTYGIVRTDRLTTSVVDGRLKAKVALQNGLFAVQVEVDGELILPVAITDKTVLVASICNQYDSMNEGDFTNVIGSYPRTYDVGVGDIFTITAIALTGLNARAAYADIVKGDVGTVSATTGLLMFTIVANIPATSNGKYEVIGKTKLNGDNAVQLKRIA